MFISDALGKKRDSPILERLDICKFFPEKSVVVLVICVCFYLSLQVSDKHYSRAERTGALKGSSAFPSILQLRSCSMMLFNPQSTVAAMDLRSVGFRGPGFAGSPGPPCVSLYVIIRILSPWNAENVLQAIPNINVHFLPLCTSSIESVLTQGSPSGPRSA